MSFNLQYREELAILTIDRPDALNALTLAYRTTDAAEGMQGFLDKRSVPFKGR